ncbi:Secreted repeat of uncharacterised function [Candidatus Anstonella stagnisolia]|nr:Secreted repeat of uncharacterised function [Candidatus Anstonella stagnisolia]
MFGVVGMGKGLLVIFAAILLLFAGCTQQSPAQPAAQPTVSPSVPPSNAQPAATPPANAPTAAVPPAAGTPSIAQPAPSTAVMVSQNAQLGSILTDGKGMTLYVFTRDSVGKTNCYNTCADLWPPLISPDGGVGGSLSGKLGTIVRADGSRQITYNGMPLYYWKGDAIPGDINGQGYGGVWFVAQPDATGFPSDMGESQAREIAAGTKECTDAGMLTSDSMYNNNSKTWWIGINSTKPGCSPACVVSANKSAQVNWRCTGLVAPQVLIVKTYPTSAFGEILTDSNGMALYVRTTDATNKFSCTGSCAMSWPALVVSSGYTTDVSGLSGTIGTLARPDGTMQATYNGMLLYTYAYDKAPGQVNGNGLGDVWYVAKTSMTTYPQQYSGGY